VHIWLGLTLSLVSVLTVAWAYSREHDIAVTLVPVSARHPFRSAQSLLGNRSWLVGFGAECAGWEDWKTSCNTVGITGLRLPPWCRLAAGELEQAHRASDYAQGRRSGTVWLLVCLDRRIQPLPTRLAPASDERRTGGR